MEYLQPFWIFLSNKCDILTNVKKNGDSIRLNTKLITSLSSVLNMRSAEIISSTSIAYSTWYRITQYPENTSVQQLLALANGLHIPVRKFFSTGSADLIGRRDDYVTDDYVSCYYDDRVLQDIVNSSSSATWKRASEAIGVTRSHLRDSLLAVTRTPVTRFLHVCEVFHMDPFTVLVDPNPETKHKTASSQAGTMGDMASLRQQLTDLEATVDKMMEKYDSILERFNRIENIINDFLETNSIGSAADDGE